VDGWDAAVKVSTQATVLALAPAASAGAYYRLEPHNTTRGGIRGLRMERVQTPDDTCTCNCK